MLLTLTRWLFVASLLSRFGAAVFLRVVISDISPGIEAALPARRRIEHRGRAHRRFRVAPVEAGAMAETATLAETLAALPTVLLGTWFGNVMLAQAIALAGTGTALALFPGAGARQAEIDFSGFRCANGCAKGRKPLSSVGVSLEPARLCWKSATS